MKPFIGEDFLLESDTARRLFFDVAQKQPIVDWHCHIPAAEIGQNRQFGDLAQMWLEADHYKWRAMRLADVDEARITGAAAPREKYDAWVQTLPRLIGNPLYHWTHLELARCFGVTDPLTPRNGETVWNAANAVIASPSFRVHEILKKFNVSVIFTTDDPADTLDAHRGIAADGSLQTRVLPAFRPDKALHIEAEGWAAYIEKLADAAGAPIRTFDGLKAALDSRMDVFSALGCRAADQSFAEFPFLPDEARAARAFAAALGGERPGAADAECFQTALLLFLARAYAARGWAMELHIGAMRNNNAKMLRALGPDAGFDSIADGALAEKLSRFLDTLCEAGSLPKAILFALNPKDNAVLAAMAGNFAEQTDGKLQLGTAWWFNDNRDGMEAQIKTYANLGVLANFVGMVTDSRSFLSYPRHEYFRRILCNVIGGWVENGEYPADFGQLSAIVEGVCGQNALRYFNLEE